MSMFPAADRRLAATRLAGRRLHEAGHAIVATALGLQVHDIVIEAGRAFTVFRVPRDATVKELEADLVATLAGIEAEELVAGPGHYGEARLRGGTDLDHARAAATRLGRRRGATTYTELDKARVAAARLVATNWSAIERLTRSLELNDDALRGLECTAAIAAAQRGSTWRRPASHDAGARSADPPPIQPFVQPRGVRSLAELLQEMALAGQLPSRRGGRALVRR